MSREINILKIITGANIKKYRDLRDLTQEQLSESIGINTSALSDIECGKTFPKPENLMKIAEVLKVPYELLFVNNIIDPKSVQEDFMRRIEQIQTDPEKFTVLYNYLKVLT